MRKQSDIVARLDRAALRRVLLATPIPLATLALQSLFWSAIQPYVWFLFYPAVFFSAWIGGLYGGISATVVSTLAVWWFFIPHRYSFALERPESAVSLVVFAGMGVLFSLTQERLHSAGRRAETALAALAAANATLEARVAERTAELTETVDALRESEAKYRGTLDAMLEGCQVIGYDWRYLYLNRTAEAHGRRPAAELIGKTLMECWPGIATTALFSLLRTSMEERTVQRLDNEFVYPDGSSNWFRLIVQPIPEGIVIFSEEIGERKRAEAANLRLQAELERRVAERTRELEESKLALLNLVDDLQQKSDELALANKELETFSYSVSHDLKAPLRGIDGYSRLLEEEYGDRFDDEGRRFLATIRRSTAQMHQLIEDLLAYSRLERRELHHVPVDLAALVRTVVEERWTAAGKSGATLTVAVPPLTVRADRDGLAVVLRNLLENALKFSRDATPPTVEIGAASEGGKTRLWVRDNGIGFDMKYHDKIFDIFQRLQRVEDYPGTGIGLALARKAMQRMGGRIWAESTPGAGATFYLEFPS